MAKAIQKLLKVLKDAGLEGETLLTFMCEERAFQREEARLSIAREMAETMERLVEVAKQVGLEGEALTSFLQEERALGREETRSRLQTEEAEKAHLRLREAGEDAHRQAMEFEDKKRQADKVAAEDAHRRAMQLRQAEKEAEDRRRANEEKCSGKMTRVTERMCYRCGFYGHISKFCRMNTEANPSLESNQNNTSQQMGDQSWREKRCFRCNGLNHMARHCKLIIKQEMPNTSDTHVTDSLSDESAKGKKVVISSLCLDPRVEKPSIKGRIDGCQRDVTVLRDTGCSGAIMRKVCAGGNITQVKLHHV